MTVIKTKNACNKYKISLNNNTWAVIFMDNMFLSIFSDFGNWGHYWTSIGYKTLAEFLVNCDKSYLMNKLSKTELDVYATCNEMRRLLLKARSSKEISKNVARNDWYRIYEIQNESPKFFQLAFQSESWGYFDDLSLPLIDKYEDGILNFMETLWPLFIEQLRKELKENDK